MTKDYQLPLIFDFLKDLSAHNERTWFQENKARYEAAHEAFEVVAADLIQRIAMFDETVAHLTVKDCTYRIYRDTRFSLDKTPYKQHFGCYVNARGKKSFHGGYYFHLEPGACMLASGHYYLPTPILKVVRQTIVEREAEFRAIVEDEEFQRLFPSVTFDPLKVLPAGLPRDFSHPEYLKCRNYCVSHTLKDSFFRKKDWMDEVIRQLRLTKPFLDFVNETVDDYI